MEFDADPDLVRFVASIGFPRSKFRTSVAQSIADISSPTTWYVEPVEIRSALVS